MRGLGGEGRRVVGDSPAPGRHTPASSPFLKTTQTLILLEPAPDRPINPPRIGPLTRPGSAQITRTRFARYPHPLFTGDPTTQNLFLKDPKIILTFPQGVLF